jgi:carboxyl-terminal processing protease
MLEGAALERAVLDHRSTDDDGEVPIGSLAQPSFVDNVTAHAKLGWWQPGWLLAVWLLGTTGMLVPLVAGIAALKRLERRSDRFAGPALSSQLAQVAHELGLSRRVTLLLSDVRAIPMTWGTLWPVLLLPREAQNWPLDRLRIVLLHEMVHVARCDYLLQLVGALARAAYWFNPLAWWGFRRLKVELEQACDDRVLSTGTLAETYAFELLHITSTFPTPGYTPSAALAIGRSARIQRRIESILDPARNRMPLTRRLACVTAVAGLLLTAALSSVHEVRGQAISETPAGAAVATDSSNANQATSQIDSKLTEQNSTAQEAGREKAQKEGKAAVSNDAAPAISSDRLSEIRKQILKSYVKSPDERALDEGAIRGMLQALDDPHSEFLPPDRLKELEQAIEGMLFGIGIEVSTTDNQLIVVAPLPGSPADAAGMRPGDAILAVDGRTVQDLGTAAAINAIRGQSGTTVALRVKRAGEEILLKVTRGSIRMPSVKGLWIDKTARKWNFWLDQGQKLGYVQISEFGKQTAEDCRSAVKTLLEQEMRGLVLDLRHCPGGLLGAAVGVAEIFLREGTIVSIKGEQAPETIFRATDKNSLGDFPLLVLVDDHTASAAEILAGALKENGRATILGTRTFGKGSVQSILPVEGTGAIRLTTAYFYVAGGRGIDRQKGAAGWGVDPTDGFYVPITVEQQDRWLKARRKSEATGDALAGPHQGVAAISAAIEAILADPQLAAAYQSISARLANGAFSKVGLSEQALRDHFVRREELLKARAQAQKQLETIDKELSATAVK